MSESNIYYHPEAHGFETVGEVDFAGSYEFDIVLVLRDVETGQLYFAMDSGCSCPAPFEDLQRDQLTPASAAEIQRILQKQLVYIEDPEDWGHEAYDRAAEAVIRLSQNLR